MKIAVLGSGMVGQAHAAKLEELGHEVTVGTHDVKKSLAKTEDGRMSQAFGNWIKKHPKVKVATFADSAKDAELVLEAISGDGAVEVLKSIAPALEGKVVVDIANALDFSKGMPPRLLVVNDDSLGEQIQRALPKAKVVKAFNTLNASVQVEPKSVAGGDHHLFIAGNDKAAKEQVVKLAKEYGWDNVMDLGDIKGSRGMEMAFILWMGIYGALGTTSFNYKISK